MKSVNIEKVQWARNKKSSPDGLVIARAYRPTGSLLSKAVDELSNRPNPRAISHPPGEYF